jgi:hypothetical protein
MDICCERNINVETKSICESDNDIYVMHPEGDFIVAAYIEKSSSRHCKEARSNRNRGSDEQLGPAPPLYESDRRGDSGGPLAFAQSVDLTP